MAEPTPLPAALVTEPLLPDAELDRLVDYIAATADQADTDLTTVIVANQGADWPELPHPRVELEDPAHAEWALRHLARADAHLEAVRAQRDQWVREIDAWAESESKRAAAGAVWFRHLLESYGRAAREADPKRATIHFPSGVIETTLRKPAARVVDDEALVDWALAFAKPAVVATTTYKVPAAAAKELGAIHTAEDGTLTFRTPDGEEVPGMAVEPQRIDARVKPVTT
jgi:hypothetical protein